MKEHNVKFVRRSLALLILLLSIILWAIPSDIIELIVRQRHVLLGRYSVERFSLLLVLMLMLWLIACLLVSNLKFKEMAFRTIAVIISSLLGFAVVSLASRLIISPRYIKESVSNMTTWPGDRVEGIVRHRPVNQQYRITYTDQPQTKHSYPNPPPGFPPVTITLTTDKRGFRNQTNLKEYDIVTVGDSFVEGSRVSDDENWPTLLGKKLGQSVYNLGISGSSTRTNLNNFLMLGSELKPKIALFMIYEGNDFKYKPLDPKTSYFDEFYKYIFKESPLIVRLKRAFITYLGPINADAKVPYSNIFSWMPVEIQSGNTKPHYSFKPKRLTRLYWEKADFLRSLEWTSNANIFRKIKQLTNEKNIRLVFVYAPSKPHVVMPLIRDHVSAEQLRAFALFKKKSLTQAKEFKENLYARLDTQETVFREFCEVEGIDFISTTQILREKMAQGIQIYYTYDQHWTRFGHEAVAEVIYNYLISYSPGTN